MDLWTKFTGATADVAAWVAGSGEGWVIYTLNSAWFWFLLAMLAAVWISKRFVVKPLSRLIEFRTQVTQMESKFHMLANELKYLRLAVDELRGLAASLQEERDGIEDVKSLVDELRAISTSLSNELHESEKLRGAMDDIRSGLNSLKSQDDERADELRSGLKALIREYEEARTD